LPKLSFFAFGVKVIKNTRNSQEAPELNHIAPFDIDSVQLISWALPQSSGYGSENEEIKITLHWANYERILKCLRTENKSQANFGRKKINVGKFEP